MIYRTYFCLNRNCKHEFTVADLDHPPCPRCGGEKVQWIPKTTGVISARTANVDATVKEALAFVGDKNYNSPRMGERMAPKLNPSIAGMATKKFAAAPGWAIDCPVGKDGNINQAYCAPAGVTAKVSHGVGTKSKVRPDSPTSTGLVPRYEAVHRP